MLCGRGRARGNACSLCCRYGASMFVINGPEIISKYVLASCVVCCVLCVVCVIQYVR